jgi:PKD repeat protein
MTLELAGSEATQIATGDFDVGMETGPGTIDVALVNSTSNQLEIYFQGESGTGFAPSRYYSIPLTSPARWADAGDINHDGMCDILVGTANGNLIVFYQNEGVGISDYNNIEHACPDGLSDADIGDLDDDGELEVLVAGSDIGTLRALDLDGFVFETMTIQNGGAGPYIPLIEDVDGDGRKDAVLGSSGSFSISIHIQNDLFPVADFYPVATSTEGSLVQLDGGLSTDSNSDVSSLSYQWSVRYQGSGPWTFLGSGKQMNCSFADSGTHDLSLKVTDRGGLSAYKNGTVTVLDASPTSMFSASSVNIMEGMSITFEDLSSSPADDLTEFVWDFGDGTVESYPTRTDPSHRYVSNGTYSVKLTVVDEDGSNDSYEMTVQVDDGSPQADFDASTGSVMENGTVWFNSTSTSPSDSLALQQWKVDGQVVGSGPSMSYQFLANGTYDINLTVVDSDGSLSHSNRTITVTDQAPLVEFDYTRASDAEGIVITFHDRSTSYDPIAKRFWDMGDGTVLSGTTVHHSYSQQGEYVVELSVLDSDGSNVSLSRTLSVQDTDPEVGEIYTGGSGGTSFAKHTNVTFTVEAVQGFDPLSYRWLIVTSSGTIFEQTTDVPSFFYRFDEGGSYTVRVSVKDTDDSVDRDIQIDIVDSPPVAIFTFEVSTTEGMVYFSANQSYDPDGDTPNLQYRWAFGDGSSWTDWNSTYRTIYHQYFAEGVFSVFLQVSDGSNAAVQNSTTVILDRTPPTITFLDRPTSSGTGEAIEVVVSVSDATPLRKVVLLYTLDQVNWIEVAMALTGPGNYTGQIPSQDEEVEIFYSVMAVDSNGYNQTTVPVQLLVEQDLGMTYLIVGLLAIIAVLSAIIIYLWRTRPVVDEVFLIYHDGNLIAHQARRLKPGMDDQIMSSMLVAIQGFVTDSFKDESVTGLKRMDFGDKKLMIEKREFYYLAVVLVGSRTGNVPTKLEKVMDSIDENYGIELIAWDGDLEKMRGIKDETRPLFERVGFFEKRSNDKG